MFLSHTDVSHIDISLSLFVSLSFCLPPSLPPFLASPLPQMRIKYTFKKITMSHCFIYFSSHVHLHYNSWEIFGFAGISKTLM